jgi:signal transduction histidine kinase
MRRFGRFPIDDRKPVSHAVLHGDAVFIESLDDAERRFPFAANGLRDAGHEAYAAIPIVCAERAVGGLTLSFREPRPFVAADRQFLATLGVLAGQALERAELFARTEAARQRSELLAETSRLLASSLDYEATFESLTRLTVPALADWCTADMLTESGEVELLAVAHIDPAKVEWARELRRRNPPAPDAPTGVRAVLRTGEAEMVAVVTDAMLVAAATSAEELALLRGLGFRSYICVPMIARGRVLGALTLITTNESNRHYTPEDLSLANELAQRAAVAIDNARLHRASERARAEAEAANASKGQFLATMSHELRTPLNAISGYAELMQLEVHGPVTPQQHEDLERIKRSQRHLLSMVNDVLNFARLEAGSVQFDIDSFSVDEVLRTSQSLIGPQLRSRQLVYDYLPGSAMLMVRADRDKLQQIVLNLLSNAVKFTDHGGRITLAAEAEGDRVCIRVSDTGRGIPAEELEKIFEPFVQVDRGLTRTTEGTGLGLSISRDLARTMGGDLRVASEVGVGSTFTLCLPRG